MNKSFYLVDHNYDEYIELRRAHTIPAISYSQIWHSAILAADGWN